MWLCEGVERAERVSFEREGEETVVPVRAARAGSRAAAQGRGRRARAVAEKGAGLALRCVLSVADLPLRSSRGRRSLGWGRRAGRLGCGTRGGLPRGVGSEAEWVREVRLLGIRLAGVAVWTDDATPPGYP